MKKTLKLACGSVLVAGALTATLMAATCLEVCDATFDTCKKGCTTGDCIVGCARGYEACKKRCGQ